MWNEGHYDSIMLEAARLQQMRQYLLINTFTACIAALHTVRGSIET
jgi:hypothetical protein